MRKAKTKKKTWIAWSQDEVKLLKKLFPDDRAREIAKRTGRSLAAVRRKAYRLGLAKKLHAWLKKDLNLLKELYPSETAQQIAGQIGRSLPAICGRIQRLGLRKRFRYDERHRVVKGSKEKLCRKYKKWKVENQFYRNRSSKDGLAGWCGECLSTVRKKRRLAANS